jgi:NhaP-type Na+/H+ and K+/H+ antiporter
MPQRKAVIYLVIAIFIVAGLIVEQSLFFNLALFLILLVLLSYGWAIASVQGLKLKRITSSLQVRLEQELVEVMRTAQHHMAS